MTKLLPNFGFPGIFWRKHVRNSLKFGKLMYPDHLHNLLDFGHCLLIFPILAAFWLCETGQNYGFWAFSWECMGEMAWNLTCWSWPPSELIRFWSWSVDFPHFGGIVTEWNRSNLEFMAIFWRGHGKNGLIFCMLMFPDHLQKWLDFAHGPLIFLIFRHVHSMAACLSDWPLAAKGCRSY